MREIRREFFRAVMIKKDILRQTSSVCKDKGACDKTRILAMVSAYDVSLESLAKLTYIIVQAGKFTW